MRSFKNPEETREQEEADLKKIWLLHHNNAKPHTASILREFLEKGKIEVLAHTTHSPDLARCDFWVFRALKWESCNRHFESDIKLVTAVNHLFQDLPAEEFYKMMAAKWKERLLVCIVNGDGYFEKDIVDCDDDDDDDKIFFSL